MTLLTDQIDPRDLNRVPSGKATGYNVVLNDAT
jgi:hypothetical protein